MPYLAYSKTLLISGAIDVCSSSFTGASNPGNVVASVFSVAYSPRANRNTVTALPCTAFQVLQSLHRLQQLIAEVNAEKIFF